MIKKDERGFFQKIVERQNCSDDDGLIAKPCNNDVSNDRNPPEDAPMKTDAANAYIFDASRLMNKD